MLLGELVEEHDGILYSPALYPLAVGAQDLAQKGISPLNTTNERLCVLTNGDLRGIWGEGNSIPTVPSFLLKLPSALCLSPATASSFLCHCHLMCSLTPPSLLLI